MLPNCRILYVEDIFASVIGRAVTAQREISAIHHGCPAGTRFDIHDPLGTCAQGDSDAERYD